MIFISLLPKVAWARQSRERRKMQEEVEIETELFSLYVSFISFFLGGGRGENKKRGISSLSVATRTSKFIRNHVLRCHGDYFMLIRSRSKSVRRLGIYRVTTHDLE